MFPCETLKLRKWLRRSIAPTDEFVGALIPYLASAAMIDVTEKSRSERSQAVRDGIGADRAPVRVRSRGQALFLVFDSRSSLSPRRVKVCKGLGKK
jgi:hypothetical protein